MEVHELNDMAGLGRPAPVEAGPESPRPGLDILIGLKPHLQTMLMDQMIGGETVLRGPSPDHCVEDLMRWLSDAKKDPGTEQENADRRFLLQMIQEHPHQALECARYCQLCHEGHMYDRWLDRTYGDQLAALENDVPVDASLVEMWRRGNGISELVPPQHEQMKALTELGCCVKPRTAGEARRLIVALMDWPDCVKAFFRFYG